MLFRSDRKSTRLNSSHTIISYAVFCLKKNKTSRHVTAAPLPPRMSAAARAPPRPLVRRAQRAPAALAALGPLRKTHLLFFFLKNRPPPESSPFPHPAPLPS